MKKWLLAMVVLALAAAPVTGCAGKPKMTPTPTDITAVRITMERTACKDNCPAYMLTIYGNGSALYEGKENVKRIGGAATTVSEEKTQQLMAEFQKIDFFALSDNYTAGSSIDYPTVTTSITIDGKEKTVTHYLGDASAPKQLTTLENRIDEILNTDQLTKNYDQTPISPETVE
jgi:hypothetical protein